MALSKRDDSVTDAALIRAVLRPHATKRLARLMDVPVRTAKHWLYYGPAAARRRELALILLAEMDREDAEDRARDRAALHSIVSGG